VEPLHKPVPEPQYCLLYEVEHDPAEPVAEAQPGSEHNVPVLETASVGQAVLEPVQYSAGLQVPLPTRH